MANRASDDIEGDETYQMFIRLANDFDFFKEMQDNFQCKLNLKSNTLQWQKAIIPEDLMPRAKDKIKAKKKIPQEKISKSKG